MHACLPDAPLVTRCPCALARTASFDHIIQPWKTFDPTTYQGLLDKGKAAYVVAASGGGLLGAPGMDFVTPMMKQLLGFVGVEHVRFVHVNGTSDQSK
eukprot:2145582-Prymnesium_polylepis.1